jgi:uncharacterized protein
MATDLGWTALEWTGAEHVIMSRDATGYRADSRLILAEQDLASVSYTLDCDADWRFAGLTIRVNSAKRDRTLALSADGAGRWRADGQALPDLEGCVDVDIDCTPLTNTLPIRRLAWSPGTARDLDVAYVSVPDLSVRPVRQRYTLLERYEAHNQALYRYESGSFRADLRVDADGFVIHYPGLWRRIGPGHTVTA